MYLYMNDGRFKKGPPNLIHTVAPGELALKIVRKNGDVFYCYIDAQDYDIVKDFRWTALRVPGGISFYAVTHVHENGKRLSRTMHRMLVDYPRVDHKNLNGLDNRRQNLRPATQSQNCANRALFRTSTSGFKGVSWHKHTKKWVARIRVHDKLIALGYFKDPTDGARAYNRAALEHFGEFARLNPIE